MLLSIKNKISKIKNCIYWKVFNELDRYNSELLLSLKRKYREKRCFVLANGPSLMDCDFGKLKNEITIASNAQYLIWDKMGFIPTFLTVEDRLVAEDRATELNSIKSTIKIFPFDLKHLLIKDEMTIYINFIRNYKSFPKFSENFGKLVYWGGTVSFLNLQLAYFLGCNPIYLIGFDHDYKVPDKSKINNYVITSEEDDINHIHPNYFGRGFRWHDPNVNRMEQSYIIAKKFFDEKGIEVLNATQGGKLEAFNRISFNEIFHE